MNQTEFPVEFRPKNDHNSEEMFCSVNELRKKLKISINEFRQKNRLYK